MQPVVAITAGDPGGIGPEIIVKALKDPSIRHLCRPLVIGDPASLRAAGWRPGLGELLPIALEGKPAPGKVTAAQGDASFRAVRLGAALALGRKVAALVTAPVSKEAWALAQVGHLGHTGFLKQLSGSRRVAMMFEADGLRAALVTGHLPYQEVPRALKAADVAGTARLVHAALHSRLGIRKPRVAVCALNPHGGEHGLIGREEGPIGRAVRALRPPVAGPLPADAAWAALRLGRYDALVALYHDQALIPLKVAAPFGVVHWTLGLPFVRTSPGHGTAFDIAGKGKADPTAMIAAIKLAVRLSPPQRGEGRVRG